MENQTTTQNTPKVNGATLADALSTLAPAATVAAVVNPELANAELAAMRAEMERLKADNLRLKESARKTSVQRLTCKISEKGGLSVYGLGRFPVTLYREQWARLAAFMPEIQAFIADHVDQLKVKGE